MIHWKITMWNICEYEYELYLWFLPGSTAWDGGETFWLGLFITEFVNSCCKVKGCHNIYSKYDAMLQC